MTLGYFVTGTDTGVGKTFVACALIRHLARQGMSVIGMKPIASGSYESPEGWLNEDVELLRSASTEKVDRKLINPYAFEQPIAPHIAAQRTGVTIDLEMIRRCFDQLAERADAVVVEGVGGFRVPINEDQDTADLALALQLPVIMVVGMRLGCLNHALLTQEAIVAQGLPLAGWVANQIDPNMAEFDANLNALRQRIESRLLAVVPFEPGDLDESITFSL